MFIDAYFETLQHLIRDCGYIQSTTITTDKRSDYVGFFKLDDSRESLLRLFRLWRKEQ